MSTKAKHLSPEARDIVIEVIERYEQKPAYFFVCVELGCKSGRVNGALKAVKDTEASRAFTKTFEPRTYEELLVTRTPEMIEHYRENGIMPSAWLSSFHPADADPQQASFDHRLLALHLFLVLDENGDLP